MARERTQLIIAILSASIAGLGGIGASILTLGEQLGEARALARYWEIYANDLKTEVLILRAKP